MNKWRVSLGVMDGFAHTICTIMSTKWLAGFFARTGCGLSVLLLFFLFLLLKLLLFLGGILGFGLMSAVIRLVRCKWDKFRSIGFQLRALE